MSIAGHFDLSDGPVYCAICKKEIVSNAVSYHDLIVHQQCAVNRDEERKRILDKLGSRRLEN